MNSFIRSLLLLAAALTFIHNPLAAQVLHTTDHLVLQKGRLSLVTNGEAAPAKESVTLPNGMEVMTNGTIRLPNGDERKLKEGQQVTRDGYYIEPNGLLVEMQDHLMQKDNHLMLVKDGDLQPVHQDITLGDGTRVTLAGVVIARDGRKVRLQDGQMMALTGQRLQAHDHATMIDGEVRLQKDGSILPLPPDRTMVMSDGTKIKGNGEVAYQNGKKFTLQNGQRLTVDGRFLPPPR